MSVLTIGWLGLEVDLDTDTWDFDGDQVKLSGEVLGATLFGAQAQRHQLLGMIRNRSNQVWNVTWSEDATAKGYYRVKSGGVGTIPVSLVTFEFPFDLVLEMVPDYQSTLITYRAQGANRSGIPVGGDPGGAVTAQPFHAVPSTRTFYDQAGATTVRASRVGPGGTVYYFGSTAYSPATGFAYATAMIPPGNFLDMACYLRVNGEYMTDRQIPIQDYLVAASGWEAGNGLLKVMASASASYTFRLYFPNSTPGNWGTPYDIQMGIYLGGTFVVLIVQGFEVEELNPEEVVVRLLCSATTGGGTNDNYQVTIKLRIRRGSFLVESTMSTQGLLANLGVKDNAAVAYTALSANNKGMYRTADDADHNRLVVVSGNTQNVGSIGSGHLYTNSTVASVDFGFGCEYSGTTSAAPNRKGDIEAQFFAAQSIVQTVGY